MFINNIDISNFKCKLMSREISSSNINIDNFWNARMLTPFISDTTILSFKTIKLEIDILTNNQDDLEICKSNLINEIKKSTIKFKDSIFLYNCVINGAPSFKFIMKGNETASITLLGYSFKPEVTETMNRITSKTINVAGNTKIPAIVEITPTSDLVNITITGFSDKSIIANNLKANKKLIIDGESGLVTVDNENFFSNMDMWEFPRLNAGANTITVDKSNLDINIKFKPRYI